MDNRTKSLKNFIFALLSQVVTIALGLILPRLWIVSYGSEVSGLLNSLNQFLVYLGLFEAGVGAATMQALYKPIAQNNWDGVSGVLAATNGYYKKTGRWYFIGLLALAFLYPLIVDSSLSYATIFGAVFFSGLGNVVTFYVQGKYDFLLQADGKSYIIHFLSTAIYIATSITKIVLIALNVNIVFILVASFAVHCLQAACVLWYVKKHYPHIRLNSPPNHAALEQKNSALIHQISTLIFNNTDVLILTFFCDLRVVSVYSLFKMVTSHLDKLINLPVTSVSFAMGQLYQTDKKRYIQRVDLLESYYSALIYAVFAVTYFLFIPFMKLYTAGVTDANYIDPYLALLFVVCSLLDRSRHLTLSTINYAGHYRQTLPYTIIEASINLVVSLIGVWLLGIYGVLIGTVAALAYRTNNIICYANRKLLDRSPRKTYTIYFINIVCFLLIQVLFRLIFGSVAIDSYPVFVGVGFGCSCLALLLTTGAQTLLMPQCRRFTGQMLRKITHR